MQQITEPTKNRPYRLPLIRLDSLETFLAIEEERCLARVAARLYLSPSGVTRRLQALEKEFGTILVERQAKKVALTTAGRALLPYARSLARTTEDAAKAVRRSATWR
jgi:DNA-binding transcriptional LysR family regulator